MHLPHSRAPYLVGTRVCYVVALSAVAVAACSDAPAGPRTLPVGVSGSLVNRSGAAIPADARVVVLWAGDDDSGDYAYVFGEGTFDLARSRFMITFDRDPPSAALLGDALGVGLVVLTTDPNLREGRVPDGYDYSANIVGVSGRHAVIYLNDNPSRFAPDWPADFGRGYSLGRGIDLPGALDGFTPAPLYSMRLIVDDLANIDVVNWS